MHLTAIFWSEKWEDRGPNSFLTPRLLQHDFLDLITFIYAKMRKMRVKHYLRCQDKKGNFKQYVSHMKI